LQQAHVVERLKRENEIKHVKKLKLKTGVTSIL
jgi:hypothetical protein